MKQYRIGLYSKAGKRWFYHTGFFTPETLASAIADRLYLGWSVCVLAL